MLKQILRVLPVALCLIFNNGFAAWVQTGGPEGAPIEALAGDGKTFIASIYGPGGFLLSGDHKTWKATTADLRSIDIRDFAVSGSQVFAGTYGDGIFHSADFGRSWLYVNTFNFTSLVSCIASSGQNIFAGTPFGSLYLSTNNSTSWNLKYSELGGFINDIVVIDTSIYVCTATSLLQLNSTGTRMTVLAKNDFNAFAKQGNCFLASSYNNGIYRSTDTGKTWALINCGSSHVESLASIGSIFFAGPDGMGVIKSMDSGLTWNPVNNGLGDSYAFKLLVAGDTLYAGTRKGIFSSGDSGKTWHPLNTGLPIRSFISSLAALGNRLLASSDLPYYSMNDGDRWVLSTGIPPISVWFNCLCVHGDKIIAGTSEGVFLSPDSGISWIARNSGFPYTGTGYFPVSAVASKNGLIFAATRNGVFRSSIGSTTWTRASTGLTDTAITCCTVLDSALFIGTSDSGVFRSANNGDSWSTANNGMTNLRIKSIKAISTGILVSTADSSVYISSNGSTWFPVTFGFPCACLVTCFEQSNAKIFAGTDHNGIFVSSDNGFRWSAANDGFPSNSESVYSLLAKDNWLFAGIQRRGVWKNDFRTISVKNGLMNRKSLDRPAVVSWKSSTVLEFISTVDQPCRTTVTLYTLSGELIRRIDAGYRGRGAYAFPLERKMMPGVLIYQYQAGNRSGCGQLISVQ